MRSFLISIALLLALVFSWCGFSSYSSETLQGYIAVLDGETLAFVEDADWAQAAFSFSALQDDWTSYKKKAAFFLATVELDTIDEMMARTERYLEAEDLPSAAGELAALRTQFGVLLANEKISAGNIF